MSRARAAPTVLGRAGELVVERDPLRASGRLLRDGAMEASYVDLADVTYLEFDYMRWMRVVLQTARARRVIHIGGGGCALARSLAATDPGSRQEVCEVNPQVLELARRHLGLRRAPGLRVREAEGRAFVAGRRDGTADAIVIDAFVGAVVPRALMSTEALADAARVAPLTLFNVVDNRSARETRLVAAGLASAYPEVWALVGRTGNTVVVGTRLELGLARIAAAVAGDPSPARLVAPEVLRGAIATTTPLVD